MPVTTRKKVVQSKEPVMSDSGSEFEDLPRSLTFEEAFGYQSSVDEKESDSDWNGKSTSAKEKSKPKKGKGKGKLRKPTTEPKSLPPMSDEVEETQDVGCSNLDDFTFSKIGDRRAPVLKLKQDAAKQGGYQNEAGGDLPSVVRIEVVGNRGPITLNINLAELIFEAQKSQYSLLLPDDSAIGSIVPDVSVLDQDQMNENNDESDDESDEESDDENEETLVEKALNVEAERRFRIKVRKNLDDLRNAKPYQANDNVDGKEQRIGFKNLPAEIRMRIYRCLFVDEEAVRFMTRSGFQRSSQFLRTCSMVHNEGRAMLYGENAFHFERSGHTRGAYWEKEWKEIGFKDIRRFLASIGETNVSMMKYISFGFTDAMPTNTAYLNEEDRRCVNDPVIQHIFDMISDNKHVLSKLGLTFGLRRALNGDDYNFLKSLTRMQTHQLIHAPQYSYHGALARVSNDLLGKMKEWMEVPAAVNSDICESKKKQPNVILPQEKARNSYGGYM